MKEVKGSFTVEASVLVPFLIMVCVVFVYLGIYAYDKTLMVQDLNALAAMVRDENISAKEDVTDVCEAAFAEIKNEHPYIAMSNLKMSVSAKGNKVSLGLSGDWNMPIYRGYSRTISKERTVKRVNPAEKMYLTEIIKSTVQGEKHDDSDDIRD